MTVYYLDGEKCYLEPGQKWLPQSTMKNEIDAFTVGAYVSVCPWLGNNFNVPEFAQIKRLRFVKYNRRGPAYPQAELYGRDGRWSHIRHFTLI